MDRFAEVDAAVLEGKNDENLQLMLALEKVDPEDFEVLWRVGRAYYLVGENVADKEQASDYSTKAHSYISRALSLNSKDWQANKWMAITTGRLGDFSDTTSKIKNSYLIKEFALKAKQLNPKDATVAHILGRWCFGVANISFVERTAASAFFATPPSSTYEEAIDYFLEHEKLMEDKGGMIRNKMYLGDSYMALSKKEEAAKWFEKAIACEAKTDHDRETIESCKKKLEASKAAGWW